MAARDTWIEKLSYLEVSLAQTSDANQKFSILKSIEEAKEKIAELGGTPPVAPPPAAVPSSGWNWENLDGQHLKQLHSALIRAFQQHELEQFTRFQFNTTFDEMVAPNANLSVAVFDLLQWAEANGQLMKLFDAAIEEKPDNPSLQAIRAQNPT